MLKPNPYLFKFSLIMILLLNITACAQAGAKDVAQGNQAFQRQDYAKALDSYQAAQKAAPDIAEPIYNAANVQYQQGTYDLAQARAEQALKKATGPMAENTRFNMGNSYFKLQKYDKAIEAYKEVLWQNPQAEDAKHNLELAQKMLVEQQQQQQEQQNKDNKDNKDSEDSQDQQNKDSQDQQNKDQQASDQQKSDKDKPKDDKSSQSEQEKQAEKDEQKQPQAGQSGDDKKPPDDKSQQTSQVQTVRLTAEQARQLLESVARNAQSLQQYLQQQPMDSPADQPKEDW